MNDKFFLQVVQTAKPRISAAMEMSGLVLVETLFPNPDEHEISGTHPAWSAAVPPSGAKN